MDHDRRETWVAVCSLITLGMFVMALVMTVATHVPEGSVRLDLVIGG